MNRIAVIYIGVNIIKITLSEIQENGYFQIIDELKERISFDYDILYNKSVSKEKMSTAISILKSYKSLCTISEVNKIIAIASNEFEKAENSKEFLTLVNDTLNVSPCLLSYKDEIYYNYISAINSIYIKDGLIINIRSNSTIIANIKNSEISNMAIIPYGCINLSYKYNLIDRISTEDVEKATNLIKHELSKLDWLNSIETTTIIAMGESFKSFAKIDRGRKKFPLNNSNNYIMNGLDIHEIYNTVKCKNLKLRKSIQGLSIEKSYIIVGASIIANELVKRFNMEDITICTRDLNQGVLFEYLDKNYNKSKDILDYSIEGIMDNLNVNKTHALHVYKISNTLFNELKVLHKLNDSYINILKTASLLHDCGISIDYYNHHKHSFYIILNSYINGLNQKELLMSALTAAYHRNNTYEPPLAPYSAIINKLDIKIVEKLGVILKLSESLDRSLEGAVKKIDVNIKDTEVELILYSDLKLDLEIRQALRVKDKFKEIYNKDLVIIKKMGH